MLTIAVVLISLSLIVFFHEFGHFIFSKLNRIKVEEFGFGYPPRIIGLVKLKNNHWKIFWGKKIPSEDLASTIYSFNWIPFGGFNKIKGEEGEADNEPDSFFAKPWWQRFFAISGGVIMNLVLAILLFSVGFNLGLPSIASQKDLGTHVRVKEVGIQIIALQKSSPAEKAGLVLGDFILKIDGKAFDQIEEIQNYIRAKTNQEIILTIKRGNKEKEVKIVPQLASEVFPPELLKNQNLKGGVIGITLAKVNFVSYPIPLAIWQAIKTTAIYVGRIIYGLYLTLRELIVRQKMIGEVMGVVGIGTFIGEVYQIGFVYLLQFLAVISVAVAVFQLIPFPALDGGRLLFLFIELLRGKPVSRKVEAIIHNLGFTFLLLLMAFVTYKDLMRLGEKIFK
ncbi:MAG: RIP metalloprotease RseP [Patescibacteria group bacterium]|nr:RIP metalloprotease RseP [Patescibacteria group bacterium]